MKITYRIVFQDNQGSSAVDAIAHSVGGTWKNGVQRFDGTHDLAFVEFDADNVEYMDEILEADDNVVSYGEA